MDPPLGSSSSRGVTSTSTSGATTSSGSTFAVKTESEPASEALDFLMQNDETNSLMFDLAELLRRDPTLASLKADQESLMEDSQTSFSQLKFESRDDDKTGLTETGFQPSTAGDDVKMEMNDLDELNDFFTNDASKNVSFGVPYKPTIATSNNLRPSTSKVSTLPPPSGQQFWQQEDNLLFSHSSFGSTSGGVTFGPTTSNQLSQLSSSVPATILQNTSPLSDILPDNLELAGHSPSHAGPERHSTLHKLLLQRNKDPVSRPSPVRSPDVTRPSASTSRKRNSLSASNPLLCQQLSQSAPTRNNMEHHRIWSRREPRPHISSVCSVGNESTAILDEVNEALGGLSPNDLPDIESDEEEEGEEEEDEDDEEGGENASYEGKNTPISSEDYSEEDIGNTSRRSTTSSGSKKEKHFWMYNVQAKGPKGQKIVVETKIEDPHVLNDIVDPVFSGQVQLQGIKHSGKARRGDGNDLTANPKKLAAIGRELEHLSSVINEITPASEMPFNASRKEKNKLASRACRLKKKAQHEANKLKCHGLEEEHHALSEAILHVKKMIAAKVDPTTTASQAELTNEVEQTVANAMKEKVAGQTSEYVTRQIAKFMKNT